MKMQMRHFSWFLNNFAADRDMKPVKKILESKHFSSRWKSVSFLFQFFFLLKAPFRHGTRNWEENYEKKAKKISFVWSQKNFKPYYNSCAESPEIGTAFLSLSSSKIMIREKTQQ